MFKVARLSRVTRAVVATIKVESLPFGLLVILKSVIWSMQSYRLSQAHT